MNRAHYQSARIVTTELIGRFDEKLVFRPFPRTLNAKLPARHRRTTRQVARARFRSHGIRRGFRISLPARGVSKSARRATLEENGGEVDRRCGPRLISRPAPHHPGFLRFRSLKVACSSKAAARRSESHFPNTLLQS